MTLPRKPRPITTIFSFLQHKMTRANRPTSFMTAAVVLLLSLLTVALTLFAPASVFADNIAIVIEQGDQAPGLPIGITFTPNGLPVINAGGKVAFAGTLAGPGITSTNNEAIYVGTPGSLQLLVRKGDPAPSTEAGTIFSDLTLGNGLVITKTGEVAFKARLSGPAVTAAKNTNNTGFWVGTPGNLRLIAREGDPAPETPGAFFSEGSGSGLPPIPPYTDGGFTMKAQLSGNLGGLGNSGIWAGPPAALELALRLGAPAPAVSPGSTLSALGSPVISHSGEIAVPARVSFSGGADNLVYIGGPDELEVFVRDGDVLPDLRPNESLNAPGSVNKVNIAINDSGQLAFRAEILTPQKLTSVWAGGSNDLRLLARQGDPIPNEPGLTFGGISDLADVFINRDGEVVFQANIDGLPSGEKGLFAGTADNLGVLARTDLGVPGAGGPSIPGFHAYAINSEAQVAFFTGGASVNALWQGRPENVQLIAAPGTVVDGGAKGLKTITSFLPTVVSGGSGNEDGHPSFLSDNGQVVFSAVFGGTVAILISSPSGSDTPPNTSITSGPTGTIPVNNATFNWTGADDTTPTESLVYAYRLDPIEPSFSAFGGETTKSYSNLVNGSYTFFVKAKDLAENEDPTPATRSFMVGSAGPDITVTPTSLDFGAIAVGDRSADKVVTVTNDGTANLIITTISLGGTDPDQFAKASDKCSNKTLTPGGSCTVAARFKPTSNGVKTATLIIPSNDSDENPVNVALSGTGGSGGGGGGTPDVTVNPLTLAFGSITVGNKSTDQFVTVNNDGTGNLTISAISLGGAHPNQFAKPSDGCSKKTLAPGASCTVSARFKPTSTGAKTATLIIPSNDPDENPVSVSLSGTGTP